MMIKIHIGVGSNLGDRSQNIKQARALLEADEKVSILRSTNPIETDPLGGPAQGRYLNCIWELETDLGVRDLLALLLQIETELGRVRTLRNSPREIDLDILFYGDEVIREEGLIVPHPRLHERFFTLLPLVELVPDKIHPVFKRSMTTLFREFYENNPSAETHN